MSLSHIIKSLSQALGNKIEIINILKEVAEADYVDLLWYREQERAFVDGVNHKKTPIDILDDGQSILAQAYKTKAPYCSTHLKYESCYNVAIDNPFKLDISSELVYPLFLEDKPLGIIRFAKKKYTFPQKILNKLKIIESALIEIFSAEIDGKLDNFNKKFFSVDVDTIYDRLNSIKSECKQLYLETHHPEVIKLIRKIEKDLDDIYNYIRFNREQDSDKELSSYKLHVLIADDVSMNIKILRAMLRDVDIKFSIACDGLETLEVLNNSKDQNEPVDVIFLDHHMPKLSGLEIAKEIRKNQYDIFIVSITNDPDAIKSHIELFDYHISKPFSKSNVDSVMHQIRKKRLV